ncbi:hypothetical protein A2U01_0062646, partial [Trifolium medium]|nr:hypothetical protein [Trifolium medium]
MESITM